MTAMAAFVRWYNRDGSPSARFMSLDTQTVLVVLLANVFATALALPLLMGRRVSVAARLFQACAAAQALGWLAFLVAPQLDDRMCSTLSIALLSASFGLLWASLNAWLRRRPGRWAVWALAVATPLGYGLGFEHYALRVGWSNFGLALQMMIVGLALAWPAPHASRRWRGLVLGRVQRAGERYRPAARPWTGGRANHLPGAGPTR